MDAPPSPMDLTPAPSPPSSPPFAPSAFADDGVQNDDGVRKHGGAQENASVRENGGVQKDGSVDLGWGDELEAGEEEEVEEEIEEEEVAGATTATAANSATVSNAIADSTTIAVSPTPTSDSTITAANLTPTADSTTTTANPTPTATKVPVLPSSDGGGEGEGVGEGPAAFLLTNPELMCECCGKLCNDPRHLMCLHVVCRACVQPGDHHTRTMFFFINSRSWTIRLVSRFARRLLRPTRCPEQARRFGRVANSVQRLQFVAGAAVCGCRAL